MKKSSARKQLVSFVTSNTKIEKIKEVLAFIDDPRALDTELIQNPKTYDEAPIIFHAIGNRRSDMPALLQVFFDKGVDPHVKYDDGTLLHEAAGHQGKETISFLLDHGLDADATDNCGRTPLFHAVSQQMNGFEAIQSLLDGGADPDILNNTGESVLDTVISERYNEEGYYLLEKKLIELGFKEGADIKGEPKSVWKKSKDQSKGFVPLRPDILAENEITVNTGQEILAPTGKPSSYMADPEYNWSEITIEHIRELLYHPVKYREPDDMLDRKANHFNVGTLVSLNEEEQTCIIIEQWDTGSSGESFGYGDKFHSRPLAAICRAYPARKVKN